jgi:hypothetical protein
MREKTPSEATLHVLNDATSPERHFGTSATSNKIIADVQIA